MRAKAVQPHTRHVPQRTCVVCRQVRPKGELLRVVCADGEVEVDPTGKRRGRGAYLCRKGECWQEILKGSRLEHALRTKLSPVSRERLVQFSHEFICQ